MNILHNSSSDGVPKEAYGVNETDVDSLMQVTEGEVMLPPVTATASKILDPCCHIDNMTPEADSRKICEYLGADDHPNVRLLSMAFNAVENLDFIWPERFSNLRILNLTFNKLVNIDAIECIPSLKILRCTSNKLLEIPSASAGPTAKLSILKPLRAKSPAILLNAPDSSSTRTESVCFIFVT